ncbi:hypothetical protein AAZX31_06G090300 [Glycine max]
MISRLFKHPIYILHQHHYFIDPLIIVVPDTEMNIVLIKRKRINLDELCCLPLPMKTRKEKIIKSGLYDICPSHIIMQRTKPIQRRVMPLSNASSSATSVSPPEPQFLILDQ